MYPQRVRVQNKETDKQHCRRPFMLSTGTLQTLPLWSTLQSQNQQTKGQFLSPGFPLMNVKQEEILELQWSKGQSYSLFDILTIGTETEGNKQAEALREKFIKFSNERLFLCLYQGGEYLGVLILNWRYLRRCKQLRSCEKTFVLVNVDSDKQMFMKCTFKRIQGNSPQVFTSSQKKAFKPVIELSSRSAQLVLTKCKHIRLRVL